MPGASAQGGPEPFLAELSVPEVGRLLAVALPLPERSPALRLAWCRWRRAKRQQACHSHYRRRSPPGTRLAPLTSFRA